MLRPALKFAAGALVGMLLWWNVTPAYNRAVAAVAVTLLRADPRLHDLRPSTQKRWIYLESESATAPTSTIPADQLTYNIILFCGLVAATERRLFRKRKLGALAAGFGALFASHVLLFTMAIEATYAMSEPYGVHWGDIEGNLWYFGMMFLRLVGMMGAAFACWIVVRTHGNE